MHDNYSHEDSSLLYTEQNIPGPTENSNEYEELISNFNSQLIEHCSCIGACAYPTCKCLQKSGGDNYTLYKEEGQTKYTLKLKDSPIIECNDYCTCKTCENRVVQKGPIEGLKIKLCDDKEKGLGLFTSCLIHKGFFICEYAGELLTKRQVVQRNKINETNGRMNYIFCLNEYCNEGVIQTFVDPSNIGNIGRYINHSCDPNSHIMPVRYDSPIPKLAVFAKSDIWPETEITFHYGAHNVNLNTFKTSCDKKLCLCNSKNCIQYMPCDKY